MKNYMEILEEVSERGIRVNVDGLKNVRDNFEKEIVQIVEELPVKPTSNKEVAEYIEDKMGFLLEKKGKRGPSVAKDILENIILENPDSVGAVVLRKVLEAKSKIKTQGMVVRLLKDLQGERIHTHFTDKCSSGRIYTEKPSLQLMPLVCREYLIPEVGNIFINADYAQEELRIMAVLSGDKKLLSAIENGEDLHTTVVWEMREELKGKELTDEQRMLGKVLNYGIIYGMNADGIARTLKISRDAGAVLLEEYLTKFSGIREWLKNTAEEIMKVGYSESLISKKKCFIDYDNADQEKELRRAINHIIQATAADILKKVIEENECNCMLKGKIRMIAHDAILFECSREEERETKVSIRSAMEFAGRKFLQEVDMKLGGTWRGAMGK